MFCANCGNNNIEESKFCTYCGNKIVTISKANPSSNSPVATNNSARANEIVEYAKEIYSSLRGSLANDVQSKFCEIVKAKNFDKVISNIFISKDVILLTPHSKDRSGLVRAGIILSGGVGLIGALGAGTVAAFAQFLSSKQSEGIQNILKNLENTLVLNASTVQIKAYDYRTHWDLAGGEWETRISIGGEGFFNGKSGDCTIVFSIEGKTYERTLFAKANNKVPEFCTVLGIPIPDIKKETQFIW